jgi:hypothetical protein
MTSPFGLGVAATEKSAEVITSGSDEGFYDADSQTWIGRPEADAGICTMAYWPIPADRVFDSATWCVLGEP